MPNKNQKSEKMIVSDLASQDPFSYSEEKTPVNLGRKHSFKTKSLLIIEQQQLLHIVTKKSSKSCFLDGLAFTTGILP